MSKIDRLSLGGVALALYCIASACEKNESPDFDPCSYNFGGQSQDFYLRDDGKGTNHRLEIGKTLFLHEDEGLLLRDGKYETSLEIDSRVVLPRQKDGRIYQVVFYPMIANDTIRAHVDSICTEPDIPVGNSIVITSR